MKKAILAITVLATLIITVISCSKKNDVPTDRASAPKSDTKYKTMSGTLSVGDIHNTGLDWCHANGADTDSTFYHFAKTSCEFMNDFYGLSLDAGLSANEIVSFAQDAGYLDIKGHIKPVNDWFYTAVGNEPNLALQGVYDAVYKKIGVLTGSSFHTFIIQTMDNAILLDNTINDNGLSWVDVIVKSDVYHNGKLMPSSVAAADAMGFSDGDFYSRQSGGGRALTPGEIAGGGYHGMPHDLYWAMAFAIGYSNAVACHDPNAH